MKYRQLKKLYEQGILGSSYLCISGRVFENRDGNIVYRGIVKNSIDTHKKYDLYYIATNVKYKGRGEVLQPHQVIPTEMSAELRPVFRNGNLEKIKESFVFD